MTEIIYHYTSGQGLMGILSNSEIHCSHISFLNDPSEHEYFDEILAKLFESNPDCKSIYYELYNESYFGITYSMHDFYVLSFSKNEDSLSMWNYYAKGNGYNLGLNINNIIDRNREKFRGLFMVELLYDKIQQYQQLKNFIKSFKKDLIKFKNIDNTVSDNEYAFHNLVERFNNGLIEKRYTFKHSAYSREEEIRILIALPEIYDNEVHFRISNNGVVVEFIKLDLNLEKDLRVITIHPLGSTLHEAGVKRFIRSMTTSKSLKIIKSIIPFRNV